MPAFYYSRLSPIAAANYANGTDKPLISLYGGPGRTLNLQPSGYERTAFTENINDYRHFRAGSRTSVHVWLRRFIDYPLVRSGTLPYIVHDKASPATPPSLHEPSLCRCREIGFPRQRQTGPQRASAATLTFHSRRISAAADLFTSERVKNIGLARMGYRARYSAPVDCKRRASRT